MEGLKDHSLDSNYAAARPPKRHTAASANAGWRESRLTAVSTQDSLFLYRYLSIVLFSTQTVSCPTLYRQNFPSRQENEILIFLFIVLSIFRPKFSLNLYHLQVFLELNLPRLNLMKLPFFVWDKNCQHQPFQTV